MSEERKDKKDRHQITVTLTGELMWKFLELKEKLKMTSDAELVRMSINSYYDEMTDVFPNLKYSKEKKLTDTLRKSISS